MTKGEVAQSEVFRIVLHNGNISQEQRDANLSAMAYGVKGIDCVLVGKFQSVDSDLARPLLLPGEFINTAEVYANGAVNMFVRDRYGRLRALIRVRPLGVQVLDGQ